MQVIVVRTRVNTTFKDLYSAHYIRTHQKDIVIMHACGLPVESLLHCYPPILLLHQTLAFVH